MADRGEEDVLYADKQPVVRRTYSPAGLGASGAIDVFNVDAFAPDSRRLWQGTGDLEIVPRYLEFCNVIGIQALVSAAKAVRPRRRVVLIGLPQQLRPVMKLVGWDDLPGLVITDEDEPGQ